MNKKNKKNKKLTWIVIMTMLFINPARAFCPITISALVGLAAVSSPHAAAAHSLLSTVVVKAGGWLIPQAAGHAGVAIQSGATAIAPMTQAVIDGAGHFAYHHGGSYVAAGHVHHGILAAAHSHPLNGAYEAHNAYHAYMLAHPGHHHTSAVEAALKEGWKAFLPHHQAVASVGHPGHAMPTWELIQAPTAVPLPVTPAVPLPTF